MSLQISGFSPGFSVSGVNSNLVTQAVSLAILDAVLSHSGDDSEKRKVAGLAEIVMGFNLARAVQGQDLLGAINPKGNFVDMQV